MRLDWGKLLLFLIGIILAQRLIYFVLAMMGLSGIALTIAFEFVVSFMFTYLYYPSFKRRYAFKDPTFYRNWGMFLFVFLVLDWALNGFSLLVALPMLF